MNSKIIANGILRAIAILIGITLFLYFLHKIETVLIYIIIASVIALIARPLILFLKRKLKFPETLSVITTMVLFIALLLGIIGMFIPLVVEQGESLSLLQSDKFQADIQDIISQIDTYFKSKGINLLSELKNADIFSNFQIIPNILNSIAGAFGTFSVGLFSVLFITFFFMKDSQLFKRGLITLTPKGTEKRLYNSIEKINDLLSRYFIGLVLQILILFIIYTIVLLIFEISNAVVIAFLCALLNIIPYVGPLISGVLMLILSMTSNLGQDFQTEILPTTIYVMIGFVIAQLVDNFFSQPYIFSKTTKSHPLEIFLIIIIGGLLMGAVGMIIAVPTYTVLKVILKEFLSENKIVKSLTKNI
ncbi:AI-2E family transporter [Polaribacter sp. MSW13]|uniref:AI-2E family transporter n=1 Tax=Polaribacter marinus TaxID=2916838 RepID=A0A9X1VN66_9FLAO|nr:AI-2E family transporter [Polaribacter marinus]MCI2229614.1 AI-2E family transporter [Polaribacter marinus]